MSNEKLETLFAIEFGQLVENYLYSNPLREQLTEVICSCLQLRSKQQLAQIFAGYDVPSTANIFELIRTLNDDEFTERFFKLQTTLPDTSVQAKEAPEPVEPIKPVEVDPRPYWQRELPDENDLRNEDVFADELGDMSLLKDFKF